LCRSFLNCKQWAEIVEEDGFNKTLRRILRRTLRLKENLKSNWLFVVKELLMDDEGKLVNRS
jgi:hypothetical protein